MLTFNYPYTLKNQEIIDWHIIIQQIIYITIPSSVDPKTAVLNLSAMDSAKFESPGVPINIHFFYKYSED